MRRMMFEDTTSLSTDLFNDIDTSTFPEIELPTNPTISEPLQIISTQRGKRKLLLDGYIYRLDRANDRGIEQWRCSKKSCRGRIHLHNTQSCSSSTEHTNVTLVSSHSHAAEPAQCQAAMVVDSIRSSAQDNLNESPKQIVHRLLRSVTDETAANLPSVTAMQRSIQRRRQQQTAFDSFFIDLDHKEEFLPEEFCPTNDIHVLYRFVHDHSLAHQSELNANQILILTDEHETNHHSRLANAPIWLCTTFNEIKNDCLECILIIQVLDQDHETFLPLLYALLPENNLDYHAKLFTEVFPLETPKCILTNLDAVLIQSLNLFFLPRSTVPEMKICSLFLRHELCRSDQHRPPIVQEDQCKSIKYLLALAYIPQSDVIVAFETLQEICAVSIENIYDRFEDLCIGRLRPNGHRSQPLFNVTLWNWQDALSSFENILVINNSIKQWDEMFRTSLFATSHRSFSKIIRTIQQLHQHQINTRDRNQQTNRTNRIVQRYYANKFQQIIQSYGSLAFEDYLLHLIQYLPV